MSKINSLHESCKRNDIDQVRQLLPQLDKDEINVRSDDCNRTALHIAAFHGHGEIVKLLLTHEDIDCNIPNQWGLLAKDEAPENIKYLFVEQLNIDEESFEWFDTYKYAYRIAYECQNHLKQWLTKVSFQKLIKEIHQYIEKMDFDQNEKDLIQNYVQQAMETNDPIPLVRAYTEKTPFVTKLNEDLAKEGSDFRFQSALAGLNTNLCDNEAQKGFGGYIYTSILAFHTKLQSYRRFTGLTYRGVNMTKADLDQYQKNRSMLVRTFLSSSTERLVAENFLTSTSKGKYPVICTYNIRNANTAIDVQTISRYPNEKEILIPPFSVFTIVDIKLNLDGVSFIELEEFNSSV
ncbi:unnamed protein product [Adineta ricciae]|uniref:NAD(P)(+)--arginine ADP-ribosyltransferase n=1 Tax=Adineta ricciae TaxID=249248 RepID=A0A815NS00_ADIRI|nr:unnamed protein product [Adineta ricciae]CAF1441433.1 unnamed protein product [Adineta ricciae]